MHHGIILTVLFLFGVLEYSSVDCTSGQNLQNLLRHPHYAEGHHHHSQHATSHAHRHGSSAPSVPSYYSTGSTSTRVRPPGEVPTLPTGSWSRAGAPLSKDYYRMSGYSTLKTTSAAKSHPIVDPRIPQELSEVREANEHFVRMRSGAFCRWPRAQVVCVKDLYPEKEFLPKCTLLHRCTETAGCCEKDDLQCGPKAMQEVVLHFYVLGGDRLSSDVEKLLFVNHTECECKPKPLLNPEPSSTAQTSSSRTTDQYALRDQQNPKCRSCPPPFCVREHEDGRCSCDCFDRHKPCIRIKRGREALADSERRCVQAGHCNLPECEYGPYDADKGRCPKRPDNLGPRDGDMVRRPLPNHKNPNHRWIYFERD